MEYSVPYTIQFILYYSMIDFNNKMKLKKNEIADININNIYIDMLFSVEYDIFLNCIFSSFEYFIRFFLNLNKIKNDTRYKKIDAIKNDMPDPKYAGDLIVSLLKITVISAALRAINDDEKTLKKV